MANVIKIKRSSTASATPNTLEYGELAINYTDEKLFYKNGSNLIKEFSLDQNAGGVLNLDGGTASSVYGGVDLIDGGGA